MKDYFYTINRVRLELINFVVTGANHYNPLMVSRRGISTYMSSIVKIHACASCGYISVY